METLIPNPLVYVNFGSSQRILGMLFLCITVPPLSTTHHLLRSWSSLQPLLAELRRGKHREDIVMHLRVKTYLKCLQGFQRKHLDVGVFFFCFFFSEAYLLSLNSVSSSLIPCSGVSCAPGSLQPPPDQNIPFTACMVHEPLSL